MFLAKRHLLLLFGISCAVSIVIAGQPSFIKSSAMLSAPAAFPNVSHLMEDSTSELRMLRSSSSGVSKEGWGIVVSFSHSHCYSYLN